ncbi:MAG: type II toxin-antitoxin system RatA family toxin [Bacillota bacterium]
MPFIEVSKNVPSSPDEAYKMAKDMESYPTFMKSVDRITTLERGENHTITKWEARLQGKKMVWTERDEFDDAQLRIDYKLVEGDLKKFEGAWTFAPSGEGTQIKLTVDFELGLPMFATLLNPIATLIVRQNCEEMLVGMEQQLGRVR